MDEIVLVSSSKVVRQVRSRSQRILVRSQVPARIARSSLEKYLASFLATWMGIFTQFPQLDG
ncbi:hypothetical protein H6G17_28335 [Chroococcidiopsis sp. FACHB-1243]|uniref:hypothetical protein n=1 Tax=Chroococcidiopsis sp. [FACHB-1243] TaxID=2692781 RepID=UPI00177CFFFC|nr:hypothetical protein [Chroococcidiopsis sp. [FACHB-1243]]MBD2309367.1 hypothetical protein [Chroococcidiopsis sp. [FACHB-1243]]